MPIENPLSALTFIAAPAVLTNAAALMALGTSNRFSRTIDRCRVVASMVEKTPPDTPSHISKLRQFDNLRRRTLILLRALRAIYLSLGLFAFSSLMALLGTMLQPIAFVFGVRLAPLVAFIAGAVGVTALATACWLLVRETRYAAATIKEEVGQLDAELRGNTALIK